MNSQRDDDALGWAGDDDPTLQSGTGSDSEGAPAGTEARPLAVEPPEGWTVAGPESAVMAHEVAEAEAAASAPASSFALIALGVFGGVYLLYTIGWLIGTSRIDNPLTDALARFMFSVGLWLAVASPAVWFGSTFWLTRGRPGPRARLALLLLGAVLLVPLPFIVTAGRI